MKLKNAIYVMLGFLAIGLGVLGIILPVMPTTPFLLLALFCFAKGSDKFHAWFITTKLYKKYLQDYVATRAMKLKTKISILSAASIVLITVLILSDFIWVRILIISLLVVKYYYFLVKIGTIKNNNALALKRKGEVFEDVAHP